MTTDKAKKKESAPDLEKGYKRTREELQGLPFESIKEKKKYEDEINLTNWKRLTRFKSFRDLMDRAEFKELKDEFEAGFMCGYGDEKTINGDDSILKVYKASLGIQILVNEKKPADPVLVAQLAKSLTDSFGLLYYTVGGLISPSDTKSSSDELKKAVLKD